MSVLIPVEKAYPLRLDGLSKWSGSLRSQHSEQ